MVTINFLIKACFSSIQVLFIEVLLCWRCTCQQGFVLSCRWSKLEELLVAEAQGSLPMIFKPTLQLYSNTTNNTTRPTGIVGGTMLHC
jgi:hypothetical protein